MVSLKIPVATYRLQLCRGFRFEKARAIVPYLHHLGISDIYASPILKARQDSLHGYDVTDPTCLNPELGSEHEFESLVQKLQVYKMGVLLDIVPNLRVSRNTVLIFSPERLSVCLLLPEKYVWLIFFIDSL